MSYETVSLFITAAAPIFFLAWCFNQIVSFMFNR